jgi:hypothetical protein
MNSGAQFLLPGAPFSTWLDRLKRRYRFQPRKRRDGFDGCTRFLRRDGTADSGLWHALERVRVNGSEHKLRACPETSTPRARSSERRMINEV